jgi:hypothetical protein
VIVVIDDPGPPVVACFFCDRVLPLDMSKYIVDRAPIGAIVALLPVCQGCVDDRASHTKHGRNAYVVAGEADR